MGKVKSYYQEIKEEMDKLGPDERIPYLQSEYDRLLAKLCEEDLLDEEEEEKK